MSLADGAAWEKDFGWVGPSHEGTMELNEFKGTSFKFTDAEHFARVNRAVETLNTALELAFAAGLEIELDIESKSVRLAEPDPSIITAERHNVTVLGAQVELLTFARKFK